MLHGVWQGYRGGHETAVPDVDTGVPVAKLRELLEKLTTLPEGFTPHPKIHNGGQPKKPEGLFQKRAAMSRGEQPLDWGAAELLAYASLAEQGHRVRLHGQDCERGTFSHRHAVVFDYHTGKPHCTLKHLGPQQGPVDVFNSALSETGVMGFDYGYSLDYPDGLVIWEAQFGDFVNVAQVIIDQFIVSAEDKWNRLSGLVMLLPHGFEGAGPEHSSARLERFLMLAAEDNIQIAYPSTPAQIFHLLRRQLVKKWRKPLIVMTPKSHLRPPTGYASSLEELSQGTFRRLLPDALKTTPHEVKRILICTGKIYRELELRRERLGRTDIAIMRLEQLYPLPLEELRTELQRYEPNTPVVFVQEEPENMGAWRFLLTSFGPRLFDRHPFTGVHRPASASPATGSFHSHEIEQQRILQEAFGEQVEPR
jgi:2-oxoglutarate dehydrogenase E1 component